MPLVFLLYDRALDNNSFFDIIIFSISLSLVFTAFHPQNIYITAFFFTTYLIIFLINRDDDEPIRVKINKILKLLIVGGVFTLSLSAIFFVPLFNNVSAPYITSRIYRIEEAFLPSFSSMFDAFTLKGAEVWGYVNIIDVTREISFPGFPSFPIHLTLFVFAYTIIFFKRNKYIYLFFITALISSFLSKGPHEPLEEVFIWMWLNVPRFNLFHY
jgi:hypothetical protein